MSMPKCQARIRTRGYAEICEPRAEIFGTGAPFVEGWVAAREASEQLAQAVEQAGARDRLGWLRADVSVSGQGLVCVGALEPDTARLLAALINRGLCAEMDAEDVA
jgi:hypothetical protein